MTLMRSTLADLLLSIGDTDPSGVRGGQNYALRNRLIYAAMYEAASIGLRAGFKIDPAEPDWPVAYIDLPEVGQVSWHLPAYPGEFDGHTTTEKYRRIDVFAG